MLFRCQKEDRDLQTCPASQLLIGFLSWRQISRNAEKLLTMLAVHNLWLIRPGKKRVTLRGTILVVQFLGHVMILPYWRFIIHVTRRR